MRNKIIVHCLVKNEENFIWYALQSVLPFVDKIMVWDTGSADKTVEIIKTINSSKIDLKEVGPTDAEGHTKQRNEMLEETGREYRWLLVLDGDEIWKGKDLREMIQRADKETPDAVVIKTINLVGDIYHSLPESAGQYKILGQKGHLNLRLINLNLPNLKVQNPHGGQSYTTNGQLLLELNQDKLVVWDDISYLHATHLVRSPLDKITLKRSFKRKYELGEKVFKENLPEVFFQKHPTIVPDITQKMNLTTWTRCFIETIPRRIKRLVFSPKNAGY